MPRNNRISGFVSRKLKQVFCVGSAAGELVALFNGYRIAKSTNKKAIKYGDEEWSDFRS